MAANLIYLAYFLSGPCMYLLAKIARLSIGCPILGDCYEKGWEVHGDIELLFTIWMAILPLIIFGWISKKISSS